MKKTQLIISILGLLLSPQVVHAKGETYFGLAMLNSTYAAEGNDHHATGIVGRLGYDFSRHFALETHFGGDVGQESNVSPNFGRARIVDMYSAFLCVNSYFGNKRVYALGGVSRGTRELTAPGSTVATRDSGSTKSYGLGLEAYENDDISFQLEWVRYFDSRFYQVDAWNLGLVTRF